MSSIDEKAKALGIRFTPPAERPYLNKCARLGSTYLTSGHVSKKVGKLGRDLTADEGYEAGREAIIELLSSVAATHGTLEGLRFVKLLGCVNVMPEFTDIPKVVHGASDLIHELFGKEGNGYHARSALGFASLPGGFAVEIEAILEIIGA